MKEFITIFMPIITIIIFIIGIAFRFYKWFSLKNPSMTLFPKPESGMFIEVVKETFFFPGVFTADKPLWFGAWMFHFFLALIFIGHIRVFIDFTPLWNLLSMDEQSVDSFSATVGGFAGICILGLTLYLILRRMLIKRVKQISSYGDHFALLLIILILASGNMMRFGEHFDLIATRQYFSSLITLKSITLPDNSKFLVHFLLAQLLIIYMPFSKILHFGGIFFSHKVLRKD